METEPLRGYRQFQFEPRELSFNVGDTVTFHVSATSEWHTFTSPGLWIDEVIQRTVDNVFTYRLNRAGSFEVTCIPHPWMELTINVAP